MIHKTFKYDFSDLKLTVPQIESVMGYKPGESQENVYEIISSVLKELETLPGIKAEYRLFEKIKVSGAVSGPVLTILLRLFPK